MAAGLGYSGGNAADGFCPMSLPTQPPSAIARRTSNARWHCLLSRHQRLREEPAVAAGLGSSGGNAADGFCPMSLPTPRHQQLREEPALAAGPGSFGGDAADSFCPMALPAQPTPSALAGNQQWQQALGILEVMQQMVSARCHCLPSRHQQLREEPAMAAGLWVFWRVSKKWFLPGVIAYSAAISACEKNQQWQQASGLSESGAADGPCSTSLPTQPPSALARRTSNSSRPWVFRL